MKDYDNFSKTFAKSRKNMKWVEIEYFMSFLLSRFHKDDKLRILDIWCGSWRLLNYLNTTFSNIDYLWIDSSVWMIEEAKNEFPWFDFKVLDMTEVDKLENKFDIIFFIASYHHLSSFEQRIETLKQVKAKLNLGWLVIMTNWNLLGERNFSKYEKNYIWNWDFQIKIWDYNRYYHSFEISELENLFANEDFEIKENRIFDNENNIISVIQKK